MLKLAPSRFVYFGFLIKHFRGLQCIRIQFLSFNFESYNRRFVFALSSRFLFSADKPCRDLLVRSRIHQIRQTAATSVIISPTSITRFVVPVNEPLYLLNISMFFGRVLPYRIKPIPAANETKTAMKLMVLLFIIESVC